MIKNPLVSIVVTTFNRSTYLFETLHSIANQTYENIEVIVVDDGSNLEESNLNRMICDKEKNCFYYHKNNTGQPDSRNYGIQKCKGTYIAFCDDDDVWVLDKLEKQLKVFELHPDYYIVTGCIGFIDIKGTKLKKVVCHTGFNHGHIFENLLLKNRTSSITPLLKREIFDNVGYFNPTFTIAEDWEFWRRVAYYYPFYAMNDILAYVRIHDSNMSNYDGADATSLSRFMLYRKLTKALLQWGRDRFTDEDITLIGKMEWKTYRKLFTNAYPGYFKKIGFFAQIAFQNFYDAIHLLYLCVKFEKNH